MRMPVRGASLSVAILVLTGVAFGAPSTLAKRTDGVGEWASWRGPHGTGVSDATDLISSWTVDGDNQIWRARLIGRSTPAVFDGRVCANGRVGEDVEMQERVACWDADSGELLWDRRFNVYNTTVPYSRVGWGSVTGDPETGNLYGIGVDGEFTAFAADGTTVWSVRLGETHGRYSGYGGRTLTPVIDEDRVILGVINASWSELGAPRHRFYAFDKHDGRVVWISSPSNNLPADLNTQGNAVVAEIGGRRMLISGAADGWIYAMEARTGEPIWSYQLSKRGINTDVVVDGDVVYATHSEENVDVGMQGRIVALDATGSGTLGSADEIWRTDGLGVGFASPLLHDGRLYLVDNSANLLAVDTASGELLWEQNIGNVGKASPVWADGKLYIAEVNGNFSILRPHDEGAEVLDTEFIAMPDGRYAEIYGSAAIAYGRIYFTTEAGLFCIGEASTPLRAAPSGATLERGIAAPDAEVARLRVVPAEVVLRAGESARFEVRAFDALGRPLGTRPATWALQGVGGTIDDSGSFTAAADSPTVAGHIEASVGGMTARTRVRVYGALPWSEEFTSGQRPRHWVQAGRFTTATLDGEPVLHKPPAPSGIHRSILFLGPEDMHGITVQIDALGTQQGRRRPGVGLVNSGYTLDLQGNHQRIQIRSWAAELRMMEQISFAWEMDTWYTIKLRVDQEPDRAIVLGKVWERGTPEPDEWTIRVEDPLPIRAGAPGIYGDSPTDVYYDNLRVMESQ